MNINLIIYLTLALLVGGATTKVHASQPMLPFSYDKKVTVCPQSVSHSKPPSFNEPNCYITTLSQVNPQNKAIWMLLAFERASMAQLSPPFGLYLMGKTTSEVYLNGVKVGSNGQPGIDKTEQVGKMDVAFYLPDSLIQQQNLLVLNLSAQHSLVTLEYPIHFVGLAQFGDPKQYIQTFSNLGLVLIGAFLLAALYFFRLSFGLHSNNNVRIFALLCLLAALQLGAELSRGLLDYDYIWHDLRLLAVTLLSFAFGILLLAYSSFNVAGKHALHWVYIGVIVTLFTIFFATGFDAKTTAGVFVPLLMSLLQLGYYWWLSKNNKLATWFVVQLVVATTIFLVASSFHEIAHFTIIATLLAYLFTRQAREYQAQLEQLNKDQTHIAKLEFRLAQNMQVQSPSKLEVVIAGKTEYVLITDIAYCKAAGDYVEMHMKGNTEKLFSGSLKQLEQMLPSIFVKTHRSYLSNLNEVVSLQSLGSHCALRLSNGATVPVSRRLAPSVRAALKGAHS